MARAGTASTKPQEPTQPSGAKHRLRQAVAVLMLCGAVALLLYGAFLGIRMHVSKAMPAWAIGHVLVCAIAAAALYTIGCRIEPLPARRARRGKRWINVEMPTQRQIWETAPLDFVESNLAAIGMMATPAMLLIGFFYAVESADFTDMAIATAVAAGAFALQGAFVSWRGRNMFDPPGRVRAAMQEKRSEPAAASNDDEIAIGASPAESDSSEAGAGSDGH